MNPLEKLLQVELTRRQFLQNTAALAASAGIAAQLNNPAVRAVAGALGLAHAQMTPEQIKKWFLSYSSESGAPWGYKSEMADRVNSIGADGVPYDKGCRVTPLINGYPAMTAMRRALDSACAQEADARKTGFVYISDWRLNAFRNLAEDSSQEATGDETVISWMLKLIQKDIRVRLLLWLPPSGIAEFFQFDPHIQDHFFVAKTIQMRNADKSGICNNNLLGVTILDTRVTKVPVANAASHHQKTMIVCVGDVQVAFCGGVDLAYTRRDSPSISASETNPISKFGGGDMQSGDRIPGKDQVKKLWNQVLLSHTESQLKQLGLPSAYQESDLPASWYGDNDQIWHDQHLQLEGAIVKTLAKQFEERWNDRLADDSVAAQIRATELTPQSQRAKTKLSMWSNNRAYIFGHPTGCLALKDYLLSLADGLHEPSNNTQNGFESAVQMWRTIPDVYRKRQDMLNGGEFTAQAGIRRACSQAKQLIWIFDQYFWDIELVKLLNNRLKDPNDVQTLHLVIVLPPHADAPEGKLIANEQHAARKRAIDELLKDLETDQRKRVAIYNTYDKQRKKGIYCHAKAHTYDGDLYVCGSANLNRRSFGCDSELACAILNPNVVHDVHNRLWQLFFDQDFPIPQNASGTLSWESDKVGQELFNRFKELANESSYLIEDPWAKAEPVNSQTGGVLYNRVLDPSRQNVKIKKNAKTHSIRESSLFVLWGFDVDKTELKSEHKACLNILIERMYWGDIEISNIHGHASTTGSEQNNINLSIGRAGAVYEYLTSNYKGNIGGDQLLTQLPSKDKVVGSGSRLLKVLTTDEEAQNRRVEIEIQTYVEYDVPTPGQTQSTSNFRWEINFNVSAGKSHPLPENTKFKDFGIGGQIQYGSLTNKNLGTSKQVAVLLLGISRGIYSFSPSILTKNPTSKQYLDEFARLWEKLGINLGGSNSFSIGVDRAGSFETNDAVDWEWFHRRPVIVATIAAEGAVGATSLDALIFPQRQAEQFIWTNSAELFVGLAGLGIEAGIYAGVLVVLD